MNVAACLLLYSLVVVVAGPPLLRHLTRGGADPRLGVAAWLTAIASVLMSWVAAAVAAAVDVAGHWHHGHFIAACLASCWALAIGDAGIAVAAAR